MKGWRRHSRPGRIRRAAARALKWGALCTTAALLALCLLDLLFPFPVQRLAEEQSGGSPFIEDREGGLIACRVDQYDAWRLPVRIADVSPWLVKATVAAEDKRFWRHRGVDPLALARAVWQNTLYRRRVSGASTLTMQCIRLLRPRRRTYAAKCIEAFRAVQLEDAADKQHILELYVNLAPYGGNVVGVGAAARLYFGKRAADLSFGEAALLAGVPQRPATFNPRKHLDRALRRREFVFRRMLELRLASQGEVEAARSEPILLRRPKRRTDAPRFADYVLARRANRGGAVRTTLDPGTQAAARSAVTSHARTLRTQGVDGLAVVVIDVIRSELLAMVGSADPADPQTGFVNGATAPRQPGSLLKPFIYAAAFDAGLLTPRSVVYDVPTAWPGYQPENMDRGFLGPVPARKALATSRNLPAVRLLDRLGSARLVADLARMGLAVHAAERRCGLSLALGTAEVRLIDVANAYATLARLGRYAPLRVIKGERSAQTARIYSPGAAYLAVRCLAGAEPGKPARRAWKTGTSWNYRDAWAVAFTPRRVVAVWCGKYSGRSHPALTGARAALPLGIELLGRVDPDSPAGWPRPAAVAVRRVCALSGAPAAAVCPHTVAAEYLPGVSGDTPCSIHRLARRGSELHTCTVWPADVAAFIAAQDAAPAADRPSLEITSPAEGAEYVLPERSDTASHTLDLAARASPSTADIYWFLDGACLGRFAARRSVRWPMRVGRHELVASDGCGSSQRLRFRVIRAETPLAH